MKWNSASSRAIDMIFGVLPALFIGFLAVVGCYMTVTFFVSQIDNESQFDSDRPRVFLLFLFSLCGLLACLSLIYVSIVRENVRSRKLNIVLLAFGIALTVPLIIFPSPLNYLDSMELGIPYYATSLVVVAAKHIFMLSRASEVQP